MCLAVEAHDEPLPGPACYSTVFPHLHIGRVAPDSAHMPISSRCLVFEWHYRSLPSKGRESFYERPYVLRSLTVVLIEHDDDLGGFSSLDLGKGGKCNHRHCKQCLEERKLQYAE